MLLYVWAKWTSSYKFKKPAGQKVDDLEHFWAKIYVFFFKLNLV
jgi:hypothetical protein